MRAILVNEYVQDYQELKISEVPYPQANDGEVIVKIEAAAANFVDLLYCRGKHQNNHRGLVKPPFILGLEFAGTLLTSTPSCPFPVGKRVFGTTTGTYTTHLSLSPSQLHLVPPTLTFAQAATLPATLPVSYGALIKRGALKKGETVLIHGASGGLGLYAIQIAKAIGAIVIATASFQAKLDVAVRYGADFVVNYSENEKWEQKVKRLTMGKGVDVVFDSVGLVRRSMSCLKQRGRILVVGFAGREGDLEMIPANVILLKQAKIIGYKRFGETHRNDPTETEEIWEDLDGLLGDGKIKPIVFEKEYVGLESVKDALKDLSERRVWGKAVINIADGVDSDHAVDHKARL